MLAGSNRRGWALAERPDDSMLGRFASGVTSRSPALFVAVNAQPLLRSAPKMIISAMDLAMELSEEVRETRLTRVGTHSRRARRVAAMRRVRSGLGGEREVVRDWAVVRRERASSRSPESARSWA